MNEQPTKTEVMVLTLVLLVIFLPAFSNISVEVRKNHHKESKRSHKHQKHKNGDANPLIPPYDAYPTQSSIFDVFSFGAKGDGVSDDSKALLAAWRSACVPRATLQIPSGSKFRIKPVTLQGPCMTNFVFQIDGSLLAPPRIGSWPKSSLYQWINFKWVQNFTIQGTGIFNGQGCNWWSSSQLDYIQVC